MRDIRDRRGRHDRGLIVLCAANSYDSVKMMDQHFAERWAQRRPVLYVDPPISHLTPRRQPALASSLRGPRLRHLGDYWAPHAGGRAVPHAPGDAARH